MAITYGFFNSVSSDRVYNADTISRMFRGILTDGVYQNLDGAFQVTANSGMTLNVASGRAIVEDRWVENDATATITLDAANALLPRIDRIILRKSTTSRDVTLTVLKGTPASTPTKPDITRNGTTYDIVLAEVRVNAGATAITAANITDTRTDSSICGWVTGVVQQVDTTTLFNQYSAAYQENLEDMETWEATQKAAFDAWYASLTQDLNVDTYIEAYSGTVVMAQNDYTPTNQITLPFTSSQFASGDVLEVFLNGTKLHEDEYTVDIPNMKIVTAAEYGVGEVFNFRVLKSVIGVAT